MPLGCDLRYGIIWFKGCPSLAISCFSIAHSFFFSLPLSASPSLSVFASLADGVASPLAMSGFLSLCGPWEAIVVDATCVAVESRDEDVCVRVCMWFGRDEDPACRYCSYVGREILNTDECTAL